MSRSWPPTRSALSNRASCRETVQPRSKAGAFLCPAADPAGTAQARLLSAAARWSQTVTWWAHVARCLRTPLAAIRPPLSALSSTAPRSCHNGRGRVSRGGTTRLIQAGNKLVQENYQLLTYCSTLFFIKIRRQDKKIFRGPLPNLSLRIIFVFDAGTAHFHHHPETASESVPAEQYVDYSIWRNIHYETSAVE